MVIPPKLCVSVFPIFNYVCIPFIYQQPIYFFCFIPKVIWNIFRETSIELHVYPVRGFPPVSLAYERLYSLKCLYWFCKDILVTTEDGSLGQKGFVTAALEELLNDDARRPQAVFAVGPVPMMAAVAEQTRPYEIPTLVSLNPIMVDGTGMCGGCRVTVGGEVKFACVDGPEFDGHLVDFKELASRQQTYVDDQHCRLREAIQKQE